MKNLMKYTLLFMLVGLLAACGSSSSDAPGNGNGNGSANGNANGNGGGNGNANGNGDEEPIEPIDNVGFMIPAIPTPTPHDVIPEGERVVFVHPDGSNSAAGTEQDPFGTLDHAIDQSQPGDVIVLRGGVYDHSSTIRINANRSGTESSPVIVFAYPGEEPILDFTSQPTANNEHGMRVYASHWHLYGFTLRYAGHNGIRVDGNHNRLERLTVHGNYDTGIHIMGSANAPASHNLIMNSDSFDNFNSGVYRPRIGNNADGLAAKTHVGPGNHFYGNRAFDNSDDGFDFWEAENRIVLHNNWAFNNGNPDHFGNPGGFEGNGNGFKLGGNHKAGFHLVVGNTAFHNRGHQNNGKGFDHNNNTGAFVLIHNTAFENPRNYSFPNAPQVGDDPHVFYNNLSVDGDLEMLPSFHVRKVSEGNSWNLASSATASDFTNIDLELARAPRQPDGSLPNNALFNLTQDSQLRRAGVNIGLPFEGRAPDIGARGYQR